MHSYLVLLIYIKRINARKVLTIENGIVREIILHFKSGLPVLLLYLNKGFLGKYNNWMRF